MSNAISSTLDIGCGNNKRDPAAIGLDLRDYDDVDVVHDLEDGLPFEANCFGEVLAYSVLEHVADLPAVMAEIHRVLEDGGALKGKVPHYRDRNAYVDPTHTQLFDTKTLEYWDSTTELGKLDYFDVEFCVCEASRIQRIQFWKSRPIVFELEAIK